jgi:hypothetical protein
MCIDRMPSAGYKPNSTLQDWYTNVYPTLNDKEKPYEFIQEEGEIVYIPEGWYHASIPMPHPQLAVSTPALHTMLSSLHQSTADELLSNTTHNTKEAVGNGIIFTLSVRQRSVLPELNTSVYYLTVHGERLLQAGKSAEAIELMQTATNGKDDFRYVHLMARALAANGEVEEAEKFFRFAITANRCVITCDMISWY